MKGDVRERWQQLCEQAADEQDPLCLLELVTEINQLLSEKEERLREANQEVMRSA
jgi:chemotaxis regulatin CheY-phosphate phosphatase CheZ